MEDIRVFYTSKNGDVKQVIPMQKAVLKRVNSAIKREQDTHYAVQLRALNERNKNKTGEKQKIQLTKWSPSDDFMETQTQQALKEVIEQTIVNLEGELLPYSVVDVNDIPTNRDFRAAWIMDGSKPKEDLEKAKAIHLNRIRKLRTKELEKADKEQMIELGKGNKVKNIEARKQKLRDLPNEIEKRAFSSVDEIRKNIPVELGTFANYEEFTNASNLVQKEA